MNPFPLLWGLPTRGIEVDPDSFQRVIDFAGREWRDYRITQPQSFSRAFTPLARYKFKNVLE
ncbi:MAG: hypothetical protein R2795_21925 [Saprospiraceae bacterium]